jgi:hypothetical protein
VSYLALSGARAERHPAGQIRVWVAGSELEFQLLGGELWGKTSEPACSEDLRRSAAATVDSWPCLSLGIASVSCSIYRPVRARWGLSRQHFLPCAGRNVRVNMSQPRGEGGGGFRGGGGGGGPRGGGENLA